MDSSRKNNLNRQVTDHVPNKSKLDRAGRGPIESADAQRAEVPEVIVEDEMPTGQDDRPVLDDDQNAGEQKAQRKGYTLEEILARCPKSRKDIAFETICNAVVEAGKKKFEIVSPNQSPNQEVSQEVIDAMAELGYDWKPPVDDYVPPKWRDPIKPAWDLGCYGNPPISNSNTRPGCGHGGARNKPLDLNYDACRCDDVFPHDDPETAHHYYRIFMENTAPSAPPQPGPSGNNKPFAQGSKHRPHSAHQGDGSSGRSVSTAGLGVSSSNRGSRKDGPSTSNNPAT
ncbi:uncharacterized protein LOC128737498 [Sabethes cyaneus]|uniref:uncharacterized protein LOC128737498 n=1 Tax=Sabethes cyaneus TaxID=53552 RepID=UPI00237E1794|nr:uncharacterized protein LOC128737498 [Sabethes cyaneus]XP_053688117.1 uncharacterized protein LOC128737498 [Sabethes cyaneus]XP_053688118.1 uncharacterized protein LOC128737498 [Sabethes cyaneus]XP_053688119.1 uncharacterized protein LOC128737498 [Sabethes cyaneus]XP_053688120.1 uncharacterized protein LOC128737498 [Sabethes cyaneus]XP_053688121.1 uncharacterized protein LOC128737498 [Sabethes cyaneus]XP_053688122.1 uncharacterized protein LOC128737498 [Sabethes cyaneus]XP_053688123.1 unc